MKQQRAASNSLVRREFSGTLGDLRHTEAKQLMKSIPKSDRFMTAEYSVPLPLLRNVSIRPSDVLFLVLLCALAVRIPELWMLIVVSITAVLGLAGNIPHRLAEAFAPWKPESRAARTIIKKAIAQDISALATPLTITYVPHRGMLFSLPQESLTWTGTGRRSKHATRVVSGLIRHGDMPELGSSSPPSALGGSPESDMEAATSVEATQAWLAPMRRLHPQVVKQAGRHGLALGQTLAQVMELLGKSEAFTTEESARTLVRMRSDAHQAVQVFATMDGSLAHTPLGSGRTPVDELQDVLGAIRDEAHRITHQSQVTRADELSYLRRVGEERYRPSSLDLDAEPGASTRDV